MTVALHSPPACGRRVHVPAAGPWRAGRFSLWRTAAAAPAMVGSLLLLLVLFGWLGAWEGLVLLGWLASATLALTRRGERLAVRVGCGFRRPTAHQTELLASAWTAALTSYRLSPADVDLYVQRSAAPNAHAAGGRSIAVTTGILDEVVARRIGTGELTGLIAHELGHVQGGGTRFDLAARWCAAPWRAAGRLLFGLFGGLIRRQPRTGLALVAAAAVSIAVGQLIAARLWASAVVLAATAVAGVLCPLADAAVSRRGEYAADARAAHVGHGPALAAALTALAPPDRLRPGLAGRLLARHPDVDRRLDRLAHTRP